MNKGLKFAVTLAAATTLVGAGVGTAVAGSTSEGFACVIRTDPPDANNNAYVGRYGCSGTIAGRGYVLEDRPAAPDGQVGYKYFQAGMAWVNGSCGNGNGQYYSEFDSSSGATAQSARRERC